MAHVVDRIDPYLAGVLSTDERSAFDQHLAGCAECAGAVASAAARHTRPPALPPPLPVSQLHYGRPPSQYWSESQSNPVVWYVAAGLTVLLASLVIGIVVGRDSTNASSTSTTFAAVPSSDTDTDLADRTGPSSNDDAADDSADSDDDRPQPAKPGPRIIRTPSANRSTDGNSGRFMVESGSSSTDDSSDTSSGPQNYVLIAPPRNSYVPRSQPRPQPQGRPAPQPRWHHRGDTPPDDDDR